MMFRVKATVNIRLPSGRFPTTSQAAILEPARAELQRDVERAFSEGVDPVTGRSLAPRKTAPRNPLLVRSGALQQGAIAAAAGAELAGSTLTVRLTTPKYGVFQFAGTKRIAARRFIGASPTTLAAVRRRLRDEGLRVFGRRGVSNVAS